MSRPIDSPAPRDAATAATPAGGRHGLDGRFRGEAGERTWTFSVAKHGYLNALRHDNASERRRNEVSIDTVKSQLHQAKERLRLALGEKAGDREDVGGPS